MQLLTSFALVWLLSAAQAGPPAYVVEGDRVEASLRVHRDNLERFFVELRERVAGYAPELLPQFQDAPPEPVVFGYGLLPRIVDVFDTDRGQRISSFAYSWPATRSYVEGEVQKLAQAEADFFSRGAGDLSAERLESFIGEYRTLVRNQRVIDGYIQYNRFWQRAIALNRPRFDRLTVLYELVLSGDPETAGLIEDMLGVPEVPSFVAVEIEESSPNRVVLRVPVYTDIKDNEFLARARQAIEEMWRVRDADMSFALDIRFRSVDAADLYPLESAPAAGDHIDVSNHVSHFPPDGAVLTTGAEATHGFVGRYVALGPGDVSTRTLAHEFGHVLGFADGYLRGYRDLDEDGFEILELTTAFDDIMSAPREGRALPTHFRLILEAITAESSPVVNPD